MREWRLYSAPDIELRHTEVRFGYIYRYLCICIFFGTAYTVFEAVATAKDEMSQEEYILFFELEGEKPINNNTSVKYYISH